MRVRRARAEGCPGKGYTTIELMIVILLISILLAIAVPNFIRSRQNSRQRACMSNLRQIDQAKEQFAMERNLPQGTVVTLEEIMPDYILRINLRCPSNGTYAIKPVGSVPTCTLEIANPPHAVDAE